MRQICPSKINIVKRSFTSFFLFFFPLLRLTESQIANRKSRIAHTIIEWIFYSILLLFMTISLPYHFERTNSDHTFISSQLHIFTLIISMSTCCILFIYMFFFFFSIIINVNGIARINEEL